MKSNETDMNPFLAEKVLNDHNNPLVKLDGPPAKYTLKTDTSTAEYVEQIEDNVRHEHVDRRCNRVKAVWLPDRSLAKVTKASGATLGNFGYQDKTGKYLYPEETLFLLESNKLELLTAEDVTLSIQESYALMMKCPGFSFVEYFTYRNLAHQGFKITRELKPGSNCYDFTVRKRKGSEDGDEEASGLQEPQAAHCSKVSRLEEQSNSGDGSVFEALRRNGPQQVLESSTSDSSTSNPDYFAYMAGASNNQAGARAGPEFNIFIRRGQDVDFGRSKEKDVYAVNPNDSKVSFFQFVTVNIPGNY